MVSAVILASGRSGSDFEATFGVTHKCLVEIAGKTMVRRTLDAVRAARSVGKIVVVGPEAELRAAGVDAPIVPSDSDRYIENLACGLRAVTSERVLVIAADVPLLYADSVEAFLRASAAVEADACFPVISWQAMQAQLPGVRKTWYTLREGTFTKGNAVVGRREFLLSRLDTIERLFETRKKKRWVSLMAKGFAVRLLAHTATIAEVEAGLGFTLQARLRVIGCAPALAADVDEITDVAFMEEALAQGGALYA